MIEPHQEIKVNDVNGSDFAYFYIKLIKFSNDLTNNCEEITIRLRVKEIWRHGELSEIYWYAPDIINDLICIGWKQYRIISINICNEKKIF